MSKRDATVEGGCGEVTLTEFLLARIAEDAADAAHVAGVNWTETRVLAECKARRQLVEHLTAETRCGGYEPVGSPNRADYEEAISRFGDGARHLPDAYSPGCDGCASASAVSSSDQHGLRLLAATYADHPDYREEWNVCHCGQPVSYGFDGNPEHHRGMCAHCDSVRCDAYPGECGRP